MFIKRLITKWRYKKIKLFLTLSRDVEKNMITFYKEKEYDEDSPDYIRKDAVKQISYSEIYIKACENALTFIEREEVK